MLYRNLETISGRKTKRVLYLIRLLTNITILSIPVVMLHIRYCQSQDSDPTQLIKKKLLNYLYYNFIGYILAISIRGDGLGD